ncbi:PREDICTED: interferon alpha-5-like [Galeopterus variegatus]|uniref:Interferon alpha-5-like n=1 Tax=Galeopterus variegatus TaxID=482537 RepID=A0ABM0RHT3_GALVR|nr:PREDICTED: interferon alpha-5-like [Galeopterus variegatus]
MRNRGGLSLLEFATLQLLQRKPKNILVLKMGKKEDSPTWAQNCGGLLPWQVMGLGQVTAKGAERAGEHGPQCHQGRGSVATGGMQQAWWGQHQPSCCQHLLASAPVRHDKRRRLLSRAVAPTETKSRRVRPRFRNRRLRKGRSRALSRPPRESLEFSMVHVYVDLLMAGVVLCSVPASSSVWGMPSSHGLVNGEAIMLVRRMKKIPSHSCLKDRKNFNFPWTGENITPIQKTQATCFRGHMLQQILSLFKREDSHAAWDAILLDKLLFSLEKSLRQVQMTEGETLSCPDLGNDVRKYFQEMIGYLREEKYSPCAWEVVRVEIEVRLVLIHRLQRKVRK